MSSATDYRNGCEPHAECPAEETTVTGSCEAEMAKAAATESSPAEEAEVELGNDIVVIDPSDSEENFKPNEFLLRSLDAIEVRVEKMRETARVIEDEKISVLECLNTMMQSEAIDHLTEAEREELGLFIDRLITRCLTVEINIQTIRTPAQEQSFQKVKDLLRDLIDTLKADIERSRHRLQLYLNSCSSGVAGPTDERFQGAVLGCAAEDQKLIRKKLQELWDSLMHSEGFVSSLKALRLDL